VFRTSLILQDAKNGRASGISKGLSELAAGARFRRLRVAVAYATYSGCRDLVSSFARSLAGWRGIEKQWLISIDFGTTEVEALRYLQDLPHSEVRIPEASALLDNALFPERCFHPKTFILDSGAAAAAAPFGLFVGSANLTLSGRHAGVEHGMSLFWSSPLTRQQTAELRHTESQLTWWNDVWDSSVTVTEDLLRAYGRSRPLRAKEDSALSVRAFNAPLSPEIGAPEGIAWANARCLWVQTRELYKNFGPGRPGNQLDLRRGTRVYFGFEPDGVDQNTVLGNVTLQYEGMGPSARSMRFGNNSMDKINLPIPGEDGPPTYDNSVVHFERIGPKRFRVSLGGPRELAQWRGRSQAQELLYAFAGGRQFGFYS
jgi:hypothetical protein